MSAKRNTCKRPPPSIPNDLKDWAAIGLIVVSNSLLVWGPLLIG